MVFIRFDVCGTYGLIFGLAIDNFDCILLPSNSGTNRASLCFSNKVSRSFSDISAGSVFVLADFPLEFAVAHFGFSRLNLNGLGGFGGRAGFRPHGTELLLILFTLFISF